MYNMVQKDIPKPRITITIDPGYIRYIDSLVDAKIFATRSHAIEFAIQCLKEGDLEKHLAEKVKRAQLEEPGEV